MNNRVESVDLCFMFVLTLHRLDFIRLDNRTDVAFELALLLEDGKDALSAHRKQHNWWG